MGKPTKHQRKLAEQRRREEEWAAWAHRTPRHKVTLAEGHDSSCQSNDTAPQVGDKSAFRQIAGAQGVIGIIR